MTELPPDAGPVDRLRPGTLLREWRIGRFIARGAFGQVFEAHRASWMADEPPRALKVFDPIMSSAARATLVSEFDVLRGTRHPHLLRGEDAFDVTDGPFAGCVVFVLELADTDLASELATRGTLPPAEVASIGAHVARGLAVLHGRDQLHGDVKPANLLRVGSVWKLGDFGVSVAVQDSYSVAPGATLDYTPPELSTEQDGFRVHRSADVWALGITLWKAATGQHPFAGATPQTRLLAAMRGDRVPAAIEPELATLINSCCLAGEPRSRTPAAELAERLDALSVRLTGPPRGRAPVGPTPDSARTARLPVPSPPPAPAPHADRPVAATPPGPPPTWQLTRPLAGHRAPPGQPIPPAAAAPTPRTPFTVWLRRIRLGLCATLAVAITGGLVQLSSLAAAALPFALTVRRTVYLVLVLLALAAVGWLARRMGSRADRWSAAAAAAVTFLGGTAWLFWGV